MEYAILIITLAILIVMVILLFQLRSLKKNGGQGTYLKESHRQLQQAISASRQETLQLVQSSMKNLGQMLGANQRQTADLQDKRLADLSRQFSAMTMQNEQKLEQMRQTIEKRLEYLREDNNRQLEQMRDTVDEKLQKTLESRISQSFRLVSERQTLAVGVGDLKKVLSNVKTRGILGEIQLGSILEQILAPDQYEENVRTKSSGTERVEFAIRLPGDGDGVVYLPIDAKFPADAYVSLLDAYDAGDSAGIQEAAKLLERAVKKSAKDIHDKYVEPPATTDFAILFLPFEGLYAEVVRRGLVETLQRDYKINIAGPTTMAALLNSLQMGFKTLSIQKHSSEVWDILGAVKTEFDKFGDVLTATQNRISQAGAELDKLVGTRTRGIQRRLRSVSRMDEEESRRLLQFTDDTDERNKFT